jgi:hypothetical protein
MSFSLTNAQELLLNKFSYLDFAKDMQDFNVAKGASLCLVHVIECICNDNLRIN